MTRKFIGTAFVVTAAATMLFGPMAATASAAPLPAAEAIAQAHPGGGYGGPWNGPGRPGRPGGPWQRGYCRNGRWYDGPWDRWGHWDRRCQWRR